MRKPYSNQLRFDCQPIEQVALNLECRDEIIPVLAGLQHLYSQIELRDQVTQLIADDVNETTRDDVGREGLSYWQILVLGIVRLGCNLNYDKLQDLCENHRALREILNVGDWDDTSFRWQRIRDTLCLLNPSTLEKINELIVGHGQQLHGDARKQVRADSFVCETNIHYPTDSWLLWDVYRLLGRAIAKARMVAPEVVGSGRLQTRRVKRLQQQIARVAAHRRGATKRLKPPYKRLIRLVESVAQWARSVRDELARGTHGRSMIDLIMIDGILQEIEHILPLGARVVDQARRRILQGEQVPNEEKIFSLVEPHTELLVRGKAGKPVEFGHMIEIQQVGGKFITDYTVFPKRPAEPALIDAAIENHRELFGTYPSTLATDKGYYESMEALDDLEKKVAIVSIAKKGRRTEEQTEREHDPLFRHAQRFRAGVEGTISFLKRILRMARCFNKGWEHFVSTVGQTVFAHNLLNLARC